MADFHVGIFFLLGLIVCISGGTTDGNFQEKLLVRIQTLEKQGQKQSEKMEKMELRLESQDEKLTKQQITIHEQQETIKELERTVNELQSANQTTNREDPMTYKTHHGKSKTRQTINTNDAVKQRRVLLNSEGPVAFHAIIKSNDEVSHIGIGQKIVFPDVMINLGAGYHNLHGIFIAPQPGIYIFSTSIMSYHTGHTEIAVHLMKNGNILANTYAHGDSSHWDQGSVTVVTQLAVGDEVWVSLSGPADTSTVGNFFDTFMGCLVYPL